MTDTNTHQAALIELRKLLAQGHIELKPAAL
jgi:hypothetical protein